MCFLPSGLRWKETSLDYTILFVSSNSPPPSLPPSLPPTFRPYLFLNVLLPCLAHTCLLCRYHGIFQFLKETPACTEKTRDLKGLGHEIESKYFDKNWQVWVSIRTSTGFLTLKMILWWGDVFATFHTVKVKTYGRTYIYCSSLAKLLCDPPCFLLVDS